MSESRYDLDYGLDACADDVVTFAEAVGISSGYVLVGHSMGARIAIRASRGSRAKTQKIVLIDPPVGGPGRRKYPIPLEWLLNAMQVAQTGCAERS